MMKKNMRIMELSLAVAITVSLTGCGTQAKATDIAIDDGETIIVTEEETSKEVDISTEDEIDEITETEEVVVEETKTEEDISGTDYGYIVIYDKIVGEPLEVDFDSFAVMNMPVEYTFNEDTKVYHTDGNLAGYIKAGYSVEFNNRNDDWFRFTPKLEGVNIPTLIVRVEDITENTDGEVEEIYKLSPEKVEKMIMENIAAREIAPVFLDKPDSDMETREFTLWNKRDELSTREDITKALHEVEAGNGDFTVGYYLTFYIECTGDEEKVDCVIYYKDKAFE